MAYMSDLNQKVQTQQTEAATYTAQMRQLQEDNNGLNTENSKLELELESIDRKFDLQNALNDVLKDEIKMLSLQLELQQLLQQQEQEQHHGGEMKATGLVPSPNQRDDSSNANSSTSKD